jgi:stage V sporulation protein R
MQLIDQKTKKIMEGCKERAAKNGLIFPAETLEYVVTNRDMINLSPKVMIPTLYNYWVNDVEVLKEAGRYKLYPSNPYETVINSRPPISFYNDNNPDWLNIMIFYHVIAHIDFFQNNILFENTWDTDFVGTALADKRLIESLRSKHGRWVDYVLEFGRSIDNVLGYFRSLPKHKLSPDKEPGRKIDYFINVFLQEIEKVSKVDVIRFIERYNTLAEENKNIAEQVFFSEIKNKYPEFENKFANFDDYQKQELDILEYIIEHSAFLNKYGNDWMKSVLIIIRNTGLYFAPQMRTKILNEGWASYWHDKLFISDERIAGKESAYAKINAGVTSLSRVGLNPYAIGLRLFDYIEELANKGRFSYDFQKITDTEDRKVYNSETGKGKETIFKLRQYFSDFNLINTFIDQDFVNKHDLFVAGKRLDANRGVYQYYVKSRRADDYKQMLLDSLYHPPYIKVDKEKSNEKNLYLVHEFEGKQLFKGYIPDVLIGLEYLWGGSVQLETTEIFLEKKKSETQEAVFRYDKVVYSIKDKKVTKSKK